MRQCSVIWFSISAIAIAVACSDVSWAGVVTEKGKHWAFQPLAEVAVPESDEGNPIDAFVEKGLRAVGLNFSAPADRRVLVRRAYLDLTGLPPTFDEVESFVLDSSPEALARVVDRLLATRSYGEHWGRHWLDVARYSDAKGYVDAGEPRNPFAYTYRDYVTGAFDRDLGFDQFAREQIAADQFVVANVSSLAALGFLTVGSRYNFFPHEIIDDRIDVVTRGFLGLTVQCARCHDHKFDPISARDYYSLYSVFANSVEPTPDLAPRIGSTTGIGENDEFTKKLEDSATRHAEVREKLHQRMMHEMRAWAGDYLRYIVQTTPEHRTEPQAELRTERGLLREFSAYAGGGMVRWRRYLESRSSNDPFWGMWQRLSATSRGEIPDRFSSLLELWRQEAAPNAKLLAALLGAKVVSLADAANIYGEVLESTVEKWEALLVESPDATSLPDAADEQLRQVLYGDDSPATISIDDSDDVYTLDESVEARTSFANIERVFLENWHGVAPRPMLLAERPRAREQRVFERGDARRPGEVAPRVIPAIVTGNRAVDVQSISGRRELAAAIASSENPLTARVIVNRVWAWHFGEGLVGTPSDFGVRSNAPTHPELLDYLARWFMEHDWSLKQLHRLILSSRTWQQAAVDRPEYRAVDPENKLLWRANRQRLSFESMRDAMLAVSGQLEAFPGGPPIEKAPDDPENRWRTIYSFVDREKLPEVFSVFDFPSPDISAPERSKTTVPQQALFLLNNPFVTAQASAIAVLHDSKSGDAAIVGIYRQVLGRDPDAEEMHLAGELLVNKQTGIRELAQALLLSNEFLFSD